MQGYPLSPDSWTGGSVAGTHCRAALNWGCVNAAIIYVMWNEHHLWNVSVHQKVHLFSLVYFQ